MNYTSQNRARVLNPLGYGHTGRDFIGITDRTKSSDKFSHIRTVTLQAYKYYFQYENACVCEFLFLDNSVWLCLDMEWTQRYYWDHDIYCEGLTEVNLINLFQTWRRIEISFSGISAWIQKHSITSQKKNSPRLENHSVASLQNCLHICLSLYSSRSGPIKVSYQTVKKSISLHPFLGQTSSEWQLENKFLFLKSRLTKIQDCVRPLSRMKSLPMWPQS